MKKQTAGKQTDFAASLGLDTTQINLSVSDFHCAHPGGNGGGPYA